MNIIEAVRTGRDFRRNGYSCWYNNIGEMPDLSNADITQNDWEIKPEKKKLKIEFWVNVYSDDCLHIYYTRADAQKNAMGHRISCEHFEREIEVDV